MISKNSNRSLQYRFHCIVNHAFVFYNALLPKELKKLMKIVFVLNFLIINYRDTHRLGTDNFAKRNN